MLFFRQTLKIKQMKKLVFLFAVLLMAATGIYGQRGHADVSEGASWDIPVTGPISKALWEGRRNFPTGQYTIRVDGVVYDIWVLRDWVGGYYIIRFKPGFYSSRTANLIKTNPGQAIWGFGKAPKYQVGVNGYKYITNATALDQCGNHIAEAISDKEFHICGKPTTVVHPTTTPTSSCGGCGTQVPTTTTPPVTGGTWPGITQQPPQPQNFSLPQPERKKTWLARNWWVIPVGLLASYGAYKILHKPPAPVPTPEPEPGPEPNPAHEPNSRPAPNFGTPASSGGIIFRF